MSEKDVDHQIGNMMSDARIKAYYGLDGFPELKNALKFASKTGKGARGYPDLVAKVKDVYIIVENKVYEEKLIKLTKKGELDRSQDAVSKYAANGAGSYLENIIRDSKEVDVVIGFGCTYTEAAGACIIPVYMDRVMYESNETPIILPSVEGFSAFSPYNIIKTINRIKNPDTPDLDKIASDQRLFDKVKKFLMRFFDESEISLALGVLMTARLCPGFCINLAIVPRGADYVRSSFLKVLEIYSDYYTVPREAIETVMYNKRFFKLQGKGKTSPAVEFYRLLDELIPTDGLAYTVFYNCFVARNYEFYQGSTYRMAKKLVIDGYIPDEIKTFEFTSRFGVLTNLIAVASYLDGMDLYHVSVCTDPHWGISDAGSGMFPLAIHTFSEGDALTKDDFKEIGTYTVIGDMTPRGMADYAPTLLKQGLERMLRDGKGVFILRDYFVTTSNPVEAECRSSVAQKYSLERLVRYDTVFVAVFTNSKPKADYQTEFDDKSEGITTGPVSGHVEGSDWWPYDRLIAEVAKRPKTKAKKPSTGKKAVTENPDNPVFTISYNGKEMARATVDGDGLLVLKGSIIVADPSMPLAAPKKKRAELKKDGTISRNKFTEDWHANSVSLATCVVVGGKDSGYGKWKTESGKTLREFLEEKKRF